MKDYLIDVPFACFWVEVDGDDIITKAPPIVDWARGRSILALETWVWRKGGTMTRV